MSQKANPATVPEWDLADRLRKSLRTSGISVGEMAAHLEVSSNTVSNYINGHTTPNAATLRTWALRTDVPFEWVRHGEITDNGPSAAPGLGNTPNT